MSAESCVSLEYGGEERERVSGTGVGLPTLTDTVDCLAQGGGGCSVTNPPLLPTGTFQKDSNRNPISQPQTLNQCK